MNSRPHPGLSLNRRQFVRAAAGLSLAAMARPALGASDAPAPAAAAGRWPLRLALSSVMFGEMPFAGVCERAARLGFEAIDIWCPFDKCRHLDEVVEALGPDGLRDLLARHKLALCSFSVYNGGFSKYAEFIGRFGGGLAVRESAYGKVPPAELTARMKAFFEKLKPLIDQAGPAKARLAIENHADALLETLDSFKAFVDLNPAPDRVGLALAPYHLQAIQAPVEQAIDICGRQLLFFYAWQNAKGFKQLPGHGATDFAPWLQALARIPFAGWVNPFMHGHAPPEEMSAAVTKAVASLKESHARGVR